MWRVLELSILFAIVTISAIKGDRDPPRVVTKQGELEGIFAKTKEGREFAGFYGVPFAEPPVGDLRFKEPVPVKPWNGIRKATQDPDVCSQRNPYTRTTVAEGSEDCLYLGVYTPEVPKKNSELLPVMVFFHGGGWVAGSGISMWYGPETLLNHDVVLVVPSYRLGAFGFLSTGDDVAPGNNGMKDQVLALKWIQENIEAFGGDPNSVTLFGESAGGASAQYHMISPLSQGLFHKVISQSGTYLCPWALASPNANERATKKLARLFDCPISGSTEMIECLRKIDNMEIILKDKDFFEWDYDPMIPFKPMVEHSHKGAFLSVYPTEAFAKGKGTNIPWMTGVTSAEGALRSAGIFGNPHLIKELDVNFDKIVPMSLFYRESASDAQVVTKKIRKFYLGNGPIDENHLVNVTNLWSDGWFVAAAHEAVKQHIKNSKQPAFVYYFDHRGVSSFSQIFGDTINNYGVCHADDLQYLFPVGDGLFPDHPLSDEDKKVSRIITSLFVNFARTGNPTPKIDDLIHVNWEPVTGSEVEYLHIGQNGQLKMKKGFLRKRTKFWETLDIRPKEYLQKYNSARDEL